MLLIAGLGNPGARYARNRHNIGFMAVEAIAARSIAFGPFRARFQGSSRDGPIGERARRAARAADLHERVRPQRRRGDALLQARPRRASSSSTTNSISRPPRCGSRSAAATPATTACARSPRISATTTSACGSASAIPATRRSSTTSCSATSRSPRWAGSTRSARAVADAAPLLVARPGRELPEQGASRDRGGRLRREAQRLTGQGGPPRHNRSNKGGRARAPSGEHCLPPSVVLANPTTGGPRALNSNSRHVHADTD